LLMVFANWFSGVDCDEASIRKRVRIGKRRRSKSFIRQVFDKHASTTVANNDGELDVRSLESALLELGVSREAAAVFAEGDVNGDGILDYEEFRTVVGMGSSVEAWAKRVPWWQAVADAMPAPDAGGSDPLRTVAGLSGEQLDAVCQVVAAATAAELRLQVETLKEAFRQMDQARHEALNGGAKFQVHKASAGNIDDFHGGLGGRVGELIKFVMVCVLYSVHFLDPEVETASFMN
jgi:hypothetical protein